MLRGARSYQRDFVEYSGSLTTEVGGISHRPLFRGEMSFFKRKDIGRVYVIKMVLPDDTVIHKIGMCKSSRSTDRMMEILRSWFMAFRFVPYTELRLDMHTHRPLELEAHIHRILDHKRYRPDYDVSGHTEMFTGINEFRVIQFLKQCKDEEFDKPMFLSPGDYKVLGQLVSP